jgi:hypothetical protein
VNGQFDAMGDLPFQYASDAQAWDGAFANARVDIRWTFHVLGETLRGQVVLRPAMQVARNVVAWRGKGESP